MNSCVGPARSHAQFQVIHLKPKVMWVEMLLPVLNNDDVHALKSYNVKSTHMSDIIIFRLLYKSLNVRRIDMF